VYTNYFYVDLVWGVICLGVSDFLSVGDVITFGKDIRYMGYFDLEIPSNVDSSGGYDEYIRSLEKLGIFRIKRKDIYFRKGSKGVVSYVGKDYILMNFKVIELYVGGLVLEYILDNLDSVKKGYSKRKRVDVRGLDDIDLSGIKFFRGRK
jgi:hypothetical protein